MEDPLLRDEIFIRLLAASIEFFEEIINQTIELYPNLHQSMIRERLQLDSVPFITARRYRVNFTDVPKEYDCRIAFQALFLYLLHPHIPCTCKLALLHG